MCVLQPVNAAPDIQKCILGCNRSTCSKPTEWHIAGFFAKDREDIQMSLIVQRRVAIYSALFLGIEPSSDLLTSSMATYAISGAKPRNFKKRLIVATLENIA